MERLEADLLRKLQETQSNERAAFQKLESAMIDASMPKQKRAVGQSIDGVSMHSSSSRLFGKSGNIQQERVGSRGPIGKSR